MRMIAAALLLVATSSLMAQTAAPEQGGTASDAPATAPAAAADNSAATKPATAYGKPVSCEANPGAWVTYRSEGRDIRAWEVKPKVQGPQPSIIIAMDIFGMTDFIKGQADNLAKQGYDVVIPNLYSRLPDTEHGLNAQQAYLAYEQTSDQQALQDLSATVEYLQAEGKPTAGQPVGIVGYDMGGIYSMIMAGTDLRVQAAVNYYGRVLYSNTSRNRPMSPVDDLLNLHAPLLNFYGTNDPQVPADQIDALDSRLSHNPNGVFYQIVKYPGVGHGFLVPTRQGYNAQAAEDAASKTKGFLARYLRAEPKKSEE